MNRLSAVPPDVAWQASGWLRSATALSFGVTLMAASPLGVAPSAPVKLAMFNFELEDFSAGASSAGETPADAAKVAQVTAKVRQILAESGRYRLIDVDGAAAAPIKDHSFRDCDGCDVAIARKLGAQQSFLGVVRRISRTEYVVRFQMRDARTGAVIANESSGLRMGADYSWDRGAVQLVRSRLLATPARQ